jgi:hypothetical protein
MGDTLNCLRIVAVGVETSGSPVSEQVYGQSYTFCTVPMVHENSGHPVRACSVSSQSMWIEWDWMCLNPKQVKPLLIFFQSHPIHVFWE